MPGARTVPTLPAFTAGQELTSSDLNKITAYQAFWADPPMFRMYQTVTQPITTNTDTQITCDTPDYDTDSGRSSVTPWGYTIPVGMAGRWRFGGAVIYVANATGLRLTSLRRNGAVLPDGGICAGAGVGTAPHGYYVGVEVAVSVGDVISLYGYQSSGGSLSTNVLAVSGLSFLEGRLVSLANP